MPRIIREGYIVDPKERIEIPGEISLPHRPPPPPAEGEDGASASEAGEPQDSRNDTMDWEYEAQLAADSYLEQAQKEADALLADARRQAEELKAAAVAEGRTQAAAEKSTEIQDCIQRVDSYLDAMQATHNQFMTEYESELHDMALEIAGKVLSKRISEDDMELAELVKKAALSARKAEWIQVEISDQLPILMEYLRRELADPEYGGNVEIVAQEMAVDGCILQTPDGIVDASVSTQLKNLKEQFGQVGQR